MNIISVDPGKDGGIALPDGSVISMPIKKILVKEARYKFAYDANGKKIVIKSGANKGEFKKVIKTAAKYKTELDCIKIHWYMEKFCLNRYGTFVIEAPGNSIGNSARSTATTHYNIGKLHAIAEILDCEIVVVQAAKWKKDLKLTKDKEQCVKVAEGLSKKCFRTPRGKLLDGQAEAWLIGYWYRKFKC